MKIFTAAVHTENAPCLELGGTPAEFQRKNGGHCRWRLHDEN
jgi:hypothetical protein